MISYLRTDSTRISEEADAAAREYITAQYGENYVSQSEKTVKKGQKIGEIQYIKGDIMIHKEKILAQETINKADFLTQIKRISTQYFLILSHFL